MEGRWWAARPSGRDRVLYLVVWKDSRKRVRMEIVLPEELGGLLDEIREKRFGHNVYRLEHVFGAFPNSHRELTLYVSESYMSQSSVLGTSR